jgi:hypothetical protein
MSLVRAVKLLLGTVAFALYTWFAAVRNVPRVRARKARRGR